MRERQHVISGGGVRTDEQGPHEFYELTRIDFGFNAEARSHAEKRRVLRERLKDRKMGEQS